MITNDDLLKALDDKKRFDASVYQIKALWESAVEDYLKSAEFEILIRETGRIMKENNDVFLRHCSWVPEMIDEVTQMITAKVTATIEDHPEWLEDTEKELNLKPCPFCGSDHLQIHETFTEASIWCCDCGVVCSGAMTPNDAIKAWNRRVNDG